MREKLILLILVCGFSLVIWGCQNLDWHFAQLCGVYIVMGILSGIVMGYTPNKIADLYAKGFSNIAMVCMMLGLARGILIVLQAGNIIDTIVYYLSMPLSYLPAWLGAIAMLILQTFLNFLVPSGSGQAMTSMPIMVPLADLIDVSRDVAVLAYQFGDGLSNIVWPTAMPVVMAGLAGVKVEKWWKFMVPTFLWLVLLQAVLVVVAVFIGFGM